MELKWTRVSTGDCWPASGLFLVRVGRGAYAVEALEEAGDEGKRREE